MADVRAKYVPPAIDQVAFNCPHCGALAKQSWFTAHAERMSKDGTPRIVDAESVKEARNNQIEGSEDYNRLKALFERLDKGLPRLQFRSSACNHDLQNVFISQCFSCNDVAIWIYDRLVWPQRGEAPVPNPDLPDDIRRDYDEASTILDLSPRGAAALLRLSIQKLCKELGEGGGNINNDIAALVKRGLDVRVQRALDVVRVIGNHAVHPGQIDLRDDRATAEKLFGLVNLIAEIMISQPKHVQEMFEGLPEDALRAIENRDGG